MKARLRQNIDKAIIEGVRRNGERIFAISQDNAKGFVAVDRGILRQSGYTRRIRGGIEIGYKAPYSCIYLDGIDKSRGHVVLASGVKRSLIHLKPGDIVDNGFGEARIVIAVKKHNVKNPKLFVIETESGKRMILTDNHQVPTDKGLLEVKDLKVGNSVFVKEATRNRELGMENTEKIKSIIEYRPGRGRKTHKMVYDVQVEGNDTFIYNGIVIHNSIIENGMPESYYKGNQVVHVRRHRTKGGAWVKAHDKIFVNKRLMQIRSRMDWSRQELEASYGIRIPGDVTRMKMYGEPIFVVMDKIPARKGQFFLTRAVLSGIKKLPEDLMWSLKRIGNVTGG